MPSWSVLLWVLGSGFALCPCHLVPVPGPRMVGAQAMLRSPGSGSITLFLVCGLCYISFRASFLHLSDGTRLAALPATVLFLPGTQHAEEHETTGTIQ